MEMLDMMILISIDNHESVIVNSFFISTGLRAKVFCFHVFYRNRMMVLKIAFLIFCLVIFIYLIDNLMLF